MYIRIKNWQAVLLILDKTLDLIAIYFTKIRQLLTRIRIYGNDISQTVAL